MSQKEVSNSEPKAMNFTGPWVIHKSIDRPLIWTAIQVIIKLLKILAHIATFAIVAIKVTFTVYIGNNKIICILTPI
jgi:hypothetical protein